MPNWCSNRIEITGADTRALVEFLASETSEFDFNKIVPQPKLLDNTVSGSRSFVIDGQSVTLRSWYEPKTGDPKADAKAARPFTEDELFELNEIGYHNWYDWRLANWGTKWPASYIEAEWDDDYARFEFQTAWSPPEPVIEALRERFEDAHITAFYDEPGMCAAGYY